MSTRSNVWIHRPNSAKTLNGYVELMDMMWETFFFWGGGGCWALVLSVLGYISMRPGFSQARAQVLFIGDLRFLNPFHTMDEPFSPRHPITSCDRVNVHQLTSISSEHLPMEKSYRNFNFMQNFQFWVKNLHILSSKHLLTLNIVVQIFFYFTG